jgi:copper resistance protein C
VRAVAIALTVLPWLAAGAAAHALLRRADPAVGSTVHAPPAALTLTFSEGVEPAFSQVTVRDASGRAVAAGAPRRGGSAATLAVRLPVLAPGEYRVEWHAVSVDTHRTEGSFRFAVGR